MGMPQRSWLGPLSFIVLIDDLVACPTLHKYVDDTHSECLSSTSQVSDIDSQCLLLWTTQNSVKLNYFKTKEMLRGTLFKAEYFSFGHQLQLN